MIEIMRVLSFITGVSLLVISACGKAPFIHDYDSELSEFVSRFEILGNRHVEDLRVHFGDLRGVGNVVGLCTTYEDDRPPVITIDRAFWTGAKPLEREELMFHELGHCVLDRDHRDDKLPDGCAASIMNSYTNSEWCLELHHEDYIKELFAGAKDEI